MIQRVYTALARTTSSLGREVYGIHQAAYILAAFSLLSSLLALVRDRLLAHLFGAGYALDLYYAAFRIPDLLFVAVGSMVSVYALIPVLLSRDEKEQRATFDAIFAAFCLFSAGVSLVLFVIAPYILPLFFPLLVAKHGGELIVLTRILLLQPILLGLSNVLASVTQLRHRYILYATSPLLYNIGIICGAVFIYPHAGITGLAWGVVLGAFAHMLIQLPWIVRDGYLQSIPRRGKARALWEAARTSFPRSIALSFGQVSMLFLATIGAALQPGSVTVFTLAFNLQSVPLGLIGASYSVAAFPTLAKKALEGQVSEFVNQLISVSRHILLWSIPAAALLIILRAHIVRVILGSGAFDWTDTRLTAASLALFALSIPLHALVLLLLRGYYAAGLVRVPLLATGVGSLVTIGGSFGLITLFENSMLFRDFMESLLRITNVNGSSAIMLAWAYALGIMVTAIILIFDIERRFGGFLKGIGRIVGESISAGVIGGAVAYGMLDILGDIASTSTFMAVLIQGVAAGTAGLAAAYVIFTFLGSVELEEALRAIGQKVWRISPVGSAEDER